MPPQERAEGIARGSIAPKHLESVKNNINIKNFNFSKARTL